MSTPIRYGLADADLGRIHPQADGHLVMWADYVALAADRDKWKSWAEAENKDKKRDHADACDYIQMIVKEKNALAAENERLRKAGDAMAKHYFDLYWIMNAESTSRHEPASITDWLAAKEERGAK